jgi:antitoxin CcdA
MPVAYDSNAPKRDVIFTVNSDLLEQAAASGIDLSATLEKALFDALVLQQCEKWLEENRDVREAALRLWGDQARTIQWLTKPVQALNGKRPVNADTQDVLDFIGRLENGYCA